MGFSQTETAHHFRLTRDGGLIEVEVKDPSDAANRERVRRHLAHVSGMFAAGDFKTPMLVHARKPPGAEAMSRLKAELGYAFEETERGRARPHQRAERRGARRRPRVPALPD